MRVWVLLVIGVGTAALGLGKWMMPSQAPIARLIANAQKKVASNPRDGGSHFLLARLYSLQYAGESDQVGIYDPDSNPKLPSYLGVQVPGPAKHTAKAADALWKSVTHYQHASQLLDKDAAVRLGQGWMFEEASKWVQAKPTASPSEKSIRKLTNAQWLARASDAYRLAYELAKLADAAKDHMWIGLEDMASLEAAQNLVRLSISRQISLSSAFVAELSAHIGDMKKKPQAITPIVFSLDASTPYSAIDNPKAKVKFDLDGSGLPRRWSWITPRAAFLCWNPLGDGKIDSARDLFGNATFWMFFRNGYDALGALDDNRDGLLTGTELRFFAVWHDRNSNGVSERTEVKPLSAFGIVRISVRPQGRQGAVWFNRSGIGLRNGRSLPTFDWVAKRQ